MISNQKTKNSIWLICMSKDEWFWKDSRQEQSRKKNLQNEAQKVLKEECKCWLNLEQMRIQRERKEQRWDCLCPRREKMVMMTLECKMKIGISIGRYKRMDFRRRKIKIKLILVNLKIRSLIWIQSSSFYFIVLKRCQQQRIFSLDFGLTNIVVQRSYSNHQFWD